MLTSKVVYCGLNNKKSSDTCCVQNIWQGSLFQLSKKNLKHDPVISDLNFYRENFWAIGHMGESWFWEVQSVEKYLRTELVLRAINTFWEINKDSSSLTL